MPARYTDDANEFVIGVTGHRFLAEVPKLRASVRVAVRRIADRFPDRTYVLLSSLAEGADRLVACAAMEEFEAALVVPLPMEVDAYTATFQSQASVAEFRRLLRRASRATTPSPEVATTDPWMRAGAYIANNSDALIALWDGREAQGEGGTADVVALALRRRIPVFHVLTGNRIPGTTQPTSLGEKQGELVVHNL